MHRGIDITVCQCDERGGSSRGRSIPDRQESCEDDQLGAACLWRLGGPRPSEFYGDELSGERVSADSGGSDLATEKSGSGDGYASGRHERGSGGICDEYESVAVSV